MCTIVLQQLGSFFHLHCGKTNPVLSKLLLQRHLWLAARERGPRFLTAVTVLGLL